MKHYKTQNESTIKTRMCICGVMPMFTQVYDEDADYHFDVVYCPKCGRHTAKKFGIKKAIRNWNISTTRRAAALKNHNLLAEGSHELQGL